MSELATIISGIDGLSSSALFAVVLWRAIGATESVLIAVYDADDSEGDTDAASQGGKPKA